MIVGRGAYLEGKRRDRGTGSDFSALAAQCHDAGFVWVGLFEPSVAELSAAGDAFGIHPLALEDAEAAHERPKIDVFGDTLTVVLRPARYDDGTETVEFGQITMMCSPRHILVVRHGTAVPLDTLRTRMEAQPSWLAQGPGAVLHAIVSTVVDNYVPVLDGIDDDIVEVEQVVFSGTRADPTQRIYELQREVLQFSRAVAPLDDVLAQLRALDHPVLNDELRRYFADIDDDVRRVIDHVGTDRELLHSALEANLTQVGIRQNADMRKMSAWVAILAVPTMVAGIYGMNFENMPELRSRYGYFVVLGAIGAVCVFIWTRFRKAGWL